MMRSKDIDNIILWRQKANDLVQVGLEVLSQKSLKLRSPSCDSVRLLQAVERVKDLILGGCLQVMESGISSTVEQTEEEASLCSLLTPRRAGIV